MRTFAFALSVALSVGLGTLSDARAGSEPAPKTKAVKPTPIPKTLAEIEAHYAKKGTLEARFEQVEEIASTQTRKNSGGTLMVKRPSRFRWQTETPEPSLFVTDGKKMWQYTPPFDETDHGQVLVQDASKVQSKLADALLAGQFSQVKGLKIQQLKEGQFELVPKKGSAGTVVRATVQVDAQAKLITEVALEHAGGNKAQIKLSKIALGGALKDESFQFTPPAGTSVVTSP
ncbi:MAG: outer membrane lipoprotein chaperone LolA [Bacteriovoracia bacterium]